MGALVLATGTTERAVTNIDGHFSLNAAPGQMLQVSYVGMITQQVKAQAKPMTIVMKADSRMVDEVVVTVTRIFATACTLVQPHR